jgi:hypothetical protein
MAYYIVSFVAIALAPFLLGAMGGHLAALAVSDPRSRHRWLLGMWSVAGIGIFMAAVSSLLTFRNDVRHDRANQTDEIERRQEYKQMNEKLDNLIRTAPSSDVALKAIQLQQDLNKLSSSKGAIIQDLSPLPKQELQKTKIELQNEIIRRMASSGMAAAITKNADNDVQALSERGYLPTDWADASKRCFDLSDQLLSSMGTSQAEYMSVNKWCTETLRMIRSLNTTYFMVVESDIPLFSDAAGKKPLPIKGVMLDERIWTTGRSTGHIAVFPTIKTHYYEPGMEVSWEWRFSRIWEKTWYYDKASKTIKHAFDSSATFIGRDMKTILVAPHP